MVRTQQTVTRKRPRRSQREPTREPTPEEEEEEGEEEEEEEEPAPARHRRSTTAPSARDKGKGRAVQRYHAADEDEQPTRRGRRSHLPPPAEDEETDLQARKRGRRRRQRNDEDEDDDEEQQEEEEEQAEDAAEGRRALDPVSKLVRLALAQEYQKKPIRRQDISEKALGTQYKGDFRQVFDEAQTALKLVFGFSMVELPATTEKVSLAQQRRQAAAEAQRGGGGGEAVKAAAKKKDATTGSKSWQLVSVLPEKFRIPALLASQLPDDQTVLGIGSAIVAIVYLSNRSIGENLLKRHLRKFGIDDRIAVEGNRETGRVENILAKLVKDGYLVKLRDEVVPGQEQTFTYVIGPRGKLEMGREGVLAYVRRVYEGADGEVEENLERKVNRAMGKEDGEEKEKQQGGEGDGGEGESRGGGRGGRGRGGARGGRRRRRYDSEEEEDDGGNDYGSE
ncbi:hypothetical protein TWF696_003207 [Orbilia brochopaga]|uniref:MAGE domain-containing protein n=1 Tax=Orbilia brochopaga TaxID=3140254 RepID=A0AAV9TXL2_9PEZI